MALSGLRFALLMLIVSIAFAVETSLGFGAMLISVSLGATLVPLAELKASLVPLNLVLSIYLVVRGREHLDLNYFRRVLLPWMLLGMPVGMIAAKLLPQPIVLVGFGGYLCFVAQNELRGRGASNDDQANKNLRADRILLAAGGIIHGAFATGGPMASYVTSKHIHDKARYRTTLSALWIVLNGILFVSYALDNTFDAHIQKATLSFIFPAAFGMIVGEWMHKAIAPEQFRKGVFVMLAIAGLALFLKNAVLLPTLALSF